MDALRGTQGGAGCFGFPADGKLDSGEVEPVVSATSEGKSECGEEILSVAVGSEGKLG